jgi:hypothetical protein
MSIKKILKYKPFQCFSASQCGWIWVAYWRLWPVLLRIKFKQLFGDVKWLTNKLEIGSRQEASGGSNSIIALKIHESVRLAARLHFHDAQCLAKSIVLADMLNARSLNASVLVGVNKDGQRLTSHAWVEVDGLIVGEPESIQRGFTVLKL